jgi:chromosome segregation ATPase
MRILDLTLHNFRGFGSPATRLVFESDLVLLYGLNGAGKTSLVEGIEWLFYGTTKRRLRGESYSKLEYTKTFANVHAGLPVEVSATILMPDARCVVLTRIMVSLITEETVTLINREPASFQSIVCCPLRRSILLLRSTLCKLSSIASRRIAETLSAPRLVSRR